MTIKLGLPAEIDVVPLQDHALIFFKVDIDYLLLHHYIIIELINLKPNYRQSSTFPSTDFDPSTPKNVETMSRDYPELLDFINGSGIPIKNMEERTLTFCSSATCGEGCGG